MFGLCLNDSLTRVSSAGEANADHHSCAISRFESNRCASPCGPVATTVEVSGSRVIWLTAGGAGRWKSGPAAQPATMASTQQSNVHRTETDTLADLSSAVIMIFLPPPASVERRRVH